MKKVVMMLSIAGVFSHGQVIGMRRNIIRFGASSMMAVLMGSLFYNKGDVKSKHQPINSLDKEVIIQFYQENPRAQNSFYQKLKLDAETGNIYWFDQYRHSNVRHVGQVNFKTTMTSQSPHTQCGYQFDYDPQMGQDVLARYDCRTCVNYKIFKQCIMEGISEGRIK